MARRRVRNQTSLQDLTVTLDRHVENKEPGLQYVVMDRDRVVFEYGKGMSAIAASRPMTSETTMMAYSMTKPFTAVAALQLVEKGLLDLDGALDEHLPDTPFTGKGITIRHLLTHTSGIPNPIPLRWVHLVEDHPEFDERRALEDVLARHSDLRFEPGEKYAYSNIGYWLLGMIIEAASGQTYSDWVMTRIAGPLEVPPAEMSFTIPEPQRHSAGYVPRRSPMNWGKRFLLDETFLGGYEGRWLRIRDHYLNGPAFGGLIGTARAFARFLQDQLQDESVLLTSMARPLLNRASTIRDGATIAMTVSWHIGSNRAQTYLYKEGGGGGFHSEMRIYPDSGITSVAMANNTTFRSTPLLDAADAYFLPHP
jgi:D-alanyl-D-alanine carboxypeptidase